MVKKVKICQVFIVFSINLLQYCVGWPFCLRTAEQRFAIEFTRRAHCWGVIFFHSSCNMLHKSFAFAGFFWATTFLRISHKFSIGLRSGLCGGHCKTLIPSWLSHDLTTLLECFGSLSCWNIHASGKLSAYSPAKLFLRMSLYISPFIIPSIFTSGPTPERWNSPRP